MKSPFEKKFCGKSPLKELTAKQEANLPEALKTAIEASPNNYGSPLKQDKCSTAWSKWKEGYGPNRSREAAAEKREFYCDNGTIKLRPSNDDDIPYTDAQIKSMKEKKNKSDKSTKPSSNVDPVFGKKQKSILEQ